MDRTNAERQRYRANRKAAAADSASLQQKYTVLQQKVAVLEQELAQQRAIAKAARQDGLAMKALKAAMTKTNGGVVGFHDANFEFHEAGSPPPYPLSIPSGGPPEARLVMARMWELPSLAKDTRAVLERLATDFGENCVTPK